MTSSGPLVFSLFVVFFIHPARAATPTRNVNRELGGSISLNSEVRKGASFDDLLLRSVSQKKALAFWMPGKPLNVISPQFSGRITFREENYEFGIHNLTLEDGGIYEISMEKSGSTTEVLGRYTVFVFNVSITASRMANHSCSLDLRCEAGTGSRGVAYTWKQTATGVTISQDSWFHLLMDPKDEEDAYTCTAQALNVQGAWDVKPYKQCGPASGAEGRFGLGLPPPCLLAQALLLSLLVLL